MKQHPLKKANKGSFSKDNPGPGRTPGLQNKLTRTVKETVLTVFNEVQSDPKIKLSQFAKDYPRDFYQIAARLIPTEITGALKTVINVTDVHE